MSSILIVPIISALVTPVAGSVTGEGTHTRALAVVMSSHVSAQEPSTSAPAGGAAGQAGRGGRGGRGGQPIVLGPDDKPIAPPAPEGFNTPREGIPHGRIETIEYPSKTVGTTRKALVYTPPGYSTSRRYPVLYLLHGMRDD